MATIVSTLPSGESKKDLVGPESASVADPSKLPLGYEGIWVCDLARSDGEGGESPRSKKATRGLVCSGSPNESTRFPEVCLVLQRVLSLFFAALMPLSQCVRSPFTVRGRNGCPLANKFDRQQAAREMEADADGGRLQADVNHARHF